MHTVVIKGLFKINYSFFCSDKRITLKKTFLKVDFNIKLFICNIK